MRLCGLVNEAVVSDAEREEFLEAGERFMDRMEDQERNRLKGGR